MHPVSGTDTNDLLETELFSEKPTPVNVRAAGNSEKAVTFVVFFCHGVLNGRKRSSFLKNSRVSSTKRILHCC